MLSKEEYENWCAELEARRKKQKTIESSDQEMIERGFEVLEQEEENLV